MKHYNAFKLLVQKHSAQEQIQFLAFAEWHRTFWLKVGFLVGLISGVGVGAVVVFLINLLNK
jgi:hypothetical protein